MTTRIWALVAATLAVSGCATHQPPAGSPLTFNAPSAGPANAATPSAPIPDPAPSDGGVIAQTVPVDPLRPDVPVNIDDSAAQTDLWARVRSGFGMPDLDTDLVRDQESWYASRPDYVQRMTDRGGRYLFHIVEEVQRRGMPTELALLPFIESAFNPQAMSTAKASGMWQFVPATGRDYLLRQNVFRDDRRDVLASTRAALDHLGRLHDMFGDWQLALAAYNWGEGNVQRAIARNQKAGLPTDYASLKMPRETQLYLPKLQAVKNIVRHPDAFALTLPALTNHPYFLSVPIQRDIDVALAASYAGVDLEEFKTLNPQMNKPVILAAGTPQVLLPYDNATEFARKLSAHRGPMASWTAWVAPKTLHPAEAARLVGMTEPELREVNHIPPRMLVKAGSTLLVSRGTHAADDVSLQVADNAVMSLSPDMPPLRRVALKAGRKESVASVAKRYRLNAQQVALWNRVPPNATFRPGEPLVVFLAGQPRRAPSTRVALAKRATPHAAPAAKTHRTASAATNRTARGQSPSAARSRIRVAKTDSTGL